MMPLDDWRELEGLKDIARYEIVMGAASDDRPSVEEISIMHEITEAEARRVLELIKTANVTISWDD